MAKNEYPCTDVQPVLIYGHDGTVIRRIKTDTDGHQLVKITDGTDELAITSDGHIGTQLHDGVSTNRKVGVSPDRQLKTGTNMRLVGTTFDNTSKDINFWKETLTDGGVGAGSGSVTQDGEAVLETGTTANSTVKYETVRMARFIVGIPLEFKAVCEFYTAGVVDNIRQIGPYDDNNGFFFQLDGTTFSVGSRNAGVDTLVSSGSFNGSVSTYVMDTAPHKMVVEMSGRSAEFIIDGVLIHKIVFTHDSRPKSFTLPVTIENNNDNAQDEDVAFHITSAAVHRIGPLLTNPTSYYQALATVAGGVQLKNGAGAVRGIIVNNCENGATISLVDSLTTTTPIKWSFTSGTKYTIPAAVSLYGMPFYNGLRLYIANADASVTVIYE